MTHHHLIEEHLRRLDTTVRSDDVTDPASIDSLRNALAGVALGPSPAATARARNRLMYTLVTTPQGSPTQRAFPSVLPKSVAAAVAAVVLSGGALTASAAAGGPNVPALLLGAIGIETPVDGSNHGRSEEAREEYAPSNGQRPDVTGTANASDRSETGQERRSDRADEVQSGATATPRPSGIGGSNASETGREHANPAATLGGENGQSGEENRESRGKSGETPAAEQRAVPQGGGTGNGSQAVVPQRPELPDAAQYGQERADLGSENREAGGIPPGRGRP